MLMIVFVGVSDGLKLITSESQVPTHGLTVACAQCQNGIFNASDRIQEIAADMDLRRAFALQGGVLTAELGVSSGTKQTSMDLSPLVESGPYKGKGQCTPELLDIMENECKNVKKNGGRCSHTRIIDRISTNYLKSKLWSDVPLPQVTDRLWKIDTSYAVDGARVTMLHKYGIYVIENFITATEADHLVQTTLDKYESGYKSIMSGIGCPVLRHKCYDKNFLTYPGNHCELRTSSSIWQDAASAHDATLKRIRSKHEQLTNIPEKFYESTQTTKYRPGEFFSSHYDDDACEDQIAEIKENCKLSTRRMVTVITYLNDDNEGGATYFPDLDIRVFPKKGSAVLFNPVSVDGLLNPYSRHAAEESSSTKYVMQQWIGLGGAMSH